MQSLVDKQIIAKQIWNIENCLTIIHQGKLYWVTLDIFQQFDLYSVLKQKYSKAVIINANISYDSLQNQC